MFGDDAVALSDATEPERDRRSHSPCDYAERVDVPGDPTNAPAMASHRADCPRCCLESPGIEVNRLEPEDRDVVRLGEVGKRSRGAGKDHLAFGTDGQIEEDPLRPAHKAAEGVDQDRSAVLHLPRGEATAPPGVATVASVAVAFEVLIDGRAAIRDRPGGVERWARELATRLPSIAPGRYRVVSPGKPFANRLGQPWEQIMLPAIARAEGASLILCPANLAPVISRKAVTIIHDAAPLRHPEDYSRAYTAWHRLLLPRLVGSSRLIITPSEFSRSELVELLGADPGKVHVVSPGVAAGMALNVDPEPALERFALARPYVLTVASKVGRKNIPSLGQAAMQLAEQGIELVAVGGSRPEMRDSGPASGIRELGAVDGELLPALYAGAKLFVLPSLYEGYGLPVIEAMAAGLPVACSMSGGLREAAGGAALELDPNDPLGMARAISDLVADETRLAELRRLGLARVAGLSWGRCAELVDGLIRTALE